jgi:hypothetical protein
MPPLPQYSFMMWCLLNPRDNLTRGSKFQNYQWLLYDKVGEYHRQRRKTALYASNDVGLKIQIYALMFCYHNQEIT